MSLLNPAVAEANALPAPVFELRGRLSRIDLSMVISAAILAIGIARIGPAAIFEEYNSGGIGLYLIAASYLGFVIGVQCLQRLAASNSLMTSGVYGFTRNPAYLSFFLPLASLSYFSWQTAAASVVIYVTAMNLTVIRTEERERQARFGDAYTAYRKAVPRWIF